MDAILTLHLVGPIPTMGEVYFHKILVNECYGVLLWMIIVKCLSKWNPLGSLSGSGSMGCYSHIALSVTYISISVLHILAKGLDLITMR